MKARDNTILGMDMFDINIYDSYIFHIPHASTNIPDLTNYVKCKIDNEILKLTDWATDDIFAVDNITKIIPDFSRVFCDVERFHIDSEEPMSKYGRGFYYTKTDDNQDLRILDENHKMEIYENYYKPHHDLFNQLVQEKLLLFNTCTIIDCHSFADIPFESDIIKDENRPDICIGVDDFHTPEYLVNSIVEYFENLNFTVQINNPYSGTIVNNESYLVDKRVKSIMIELNRKLYLDDNNKVILDKVAYLNSIIRNLFI